MLGVSVIPVMLSHLCIMWHRLPYAQAGLMPGQPLKIAGRGAADDLQIHPSPCTNTSPSWRHPPWRPAQTPPFPLRPPPPPRNGACMQPLTGAGQQSADDHVSHVQHACQTRTKGLHSLAEQPQANFTLTF